MAAPLPDYGLRAVWIETAGWPTICGKRTMWTSAQSELREIVWLASVIGALSILGTGLAVALAMVLVI